MYKESGSTNFAVSIVNMHGNKVVIDTQSDTVIESLRDEAVKKFNSMKGTGFDPSCEYVLVCTGGTCKRLGNKNTVKAENVSPNDALLLHKIVSPVEKSTEVPTRSIPTMPGIKQATEGLPVRGKPDAGASGGVHPTGATLDHTFRKILLTLLDLSYKLMFFDEEADGVFNPKSKRALIDPELVSSLTNMGFSDARARKALKMTQMDLEAAMDWLLHNPEDNEDVDMEPEVTEDSWDEDEDHHSAKRVRRRLEQWQKKSKRMEPSKDHIATLVAMGFSKEDSIQALKINGNNPNTACDWLLGDRKVPDDDPNGSLSPDTELYKAVITDPTIHIGLHNKRVLEALEDMLENPMRRHNWANDSVVGSVILQILKLYHKYSNATS